MTDAPGGYMVGDSREGFEETARPLVPTHAPPPTVMKKMRGAAGSETYEVHHNRQLIGTVHKVENGWHAMHNGHEAGTHSSVKGAGRVLRNLHLRNNQAMPAVAADDGEHKKGDAIEAKWGGAWHKATYGHKTKTGHHVHWTGKHEGEHETVSEVRKPAVRVMKKAIDHPVHTPPPPASRTMKLRRSLGLDKPAEAPMEFRLHDGDTGGGRNMSHNGEHIGRVNHSAAGYTAHYKGVGQISDPVGQKIFHTEADAAKVLARHHKRMLKSV